MARSVSPCVVSSPAPRVLTTLPTYAQWPDFIVARTRAAIFWRRSAAQRPVRLQLPGPEWVTPDLRSCEWRGAGCGEAQWFPGSDAVNTVTSDAECAAILPRMVNTFNSSMVRGNVRCELWMQGAGKMLDISLIIFGSGREMMNDMRCGGRGCICSIFPPLFNLIRSEFKAEWVSKILPVIQIPDSVLEGDDASQSQAALERPRSVQYSLLQQQESPNITCDWLLFLRMRRVALNWMRHRDVHWAAQLVTQECVCSQETGVDWETGELRWILSGQNCNMQALPPLLSGLLCSEHYRR